jgi:hypothetical protein
MLSHRQTLVYPEQQHYAIVIQTSTKVAMFVAFDLAIAPTILERGLGECERDL